MAVTEPQLLNLAARCADHGTKVLHSFCEAPHADQLVSAYQTHSQGTDPHVLGVILRQASLPAGRCSKEITQTRRSQMWGLFRCPSQECSNDGM